MEVKIADIVLCEFYFSDLKTSKKDPSSFLKITYLMMTLWVSLSVVR